MSDFGPFWPFGPKKTGHRPLGVISDALWRLYFESSVSLRHKYTLRRASEITPRGWCPVFFTSLRLIGDQIIHLFGPKWPNGQKSLKNGNPLFLALFSGSYRAVRPPCRRFSKKKSGESPPLDHPPGGPHFFPKFGARVV